MTPPRADTAEARRLFALFCLASLAVAAGVGACGRVESTSSVDGGGGGDLDATTGPSPDGGADGAADAASSTDAFTIPDVAPPVVVCASDGGVACPLPPSACIDDHTLRFFIGAACDAGACVFQTNDYRCPASPIQPDCMDGGCRIIVLR